MALFDFLAFPENFKRFSEAKQKIIIHIAKNRDEFERLKTRFLELTGMEDDSKTGKEKYIGIRTRIVHLGETLEQILSSQYKINILFQELQGYSQAVLEDMFQHIYSTWEKFEYFRVAKRDKIFNNHGNQEMPLSDTVILVDIDYLNMMIPRIINFYKNYHPNKKFNNFNFQQLFSDISRNGRATEVGKIIPIICFHSSVDRIFFCDEGELAKWNNQLFELDGTYSPFGKICDNILNNRTI